MESISKLDMRLFYSEEIFYINDCSVNDTGVLIRLKSKKHDCECPNCHQISNHYHGDYSGRSAHAPKRIQRLEIAV